MVLFNMTNKNKLLGFRRRKKKAESKSLTDIFYISRFFVFKKIMSIYYSGTKKNLVGSLKKTI